MNSARVQLFHGPGQPFQMGIAPLPAELNHSEVLVQLLLATITRNSTLIASPRTQSPVTLPTSTPRATAGWMSSTCGDDTKRATLQINPTCDNVLNPS
jgi:hypothetical protein